jgi:hypothetical protein
MSLHEHGVFLEAINLADECDGPSHEVHDLLDPNEGVWLPMHCFHFLCHFIIYVSRGYIYN